MIEKANPKLYTSKVDQQRDLSPCFVHSRLEHAEISLELLVIAKRLETCGIVDLSDCRSLPK